MDDDDANYLLTYYGHLKNSFERLVYNHRFATIKMTPLPSEVGMPPEERRVASGLREMLSDDPNVQHLASEGFGTFHLRTTQRILDDHQDQIVLNCCPSCGRLARTPTAQQCRFCGHDWHAEARK